MTDSTNIDSASADRLARLQQRRPMDDPSRRRQVARRPSNGSPAAGSKVVATGASAMAVLGMVALFGQQAASSTTEAEAPVETLPTSSASGQVPDSEALASPGLSSVDVEPPNVVVLVDPAGEPVVASPSTVAAPTRVELAIPAPRQVVVSQPVPVAPAAGARQPAATAPAPVAPAPAPAPAPVPVPAPAATTQGS